MLKNGRLFFGTDYSIPSDRKKCSATYSNRCRLKTAPLTKTVLTPWKKSLKSRATPRDPQNFLRHCAKLIWNVKRFRNKKTHSHKHPQKWTNNRGVFCTLDDLKSFFKYSGTFTTPCQRPKISLLGHAPS